MHHTHHSVPAQPQITIQGLHNHKLIKQHNFVQQITQEEQCHADWQVSLFKVQHLVVMIFT